MKLDAYEYVSVAIPGVVLLFICLLLFPELREVIGRNGIDLGGLGLILLLSVGVGQVVQAAGNFVRWMDYTLDLDPSNSLLSKNQKFLESRQWERLVTSLKNRLDVDLEKLSKKGWASIRLEMRDIVIGAGGGPKLTKFTQNAALARGLTAACLLAIPLVFWTNMILKDQIIFAFALGVCAALVYYRMRRALNFYLSHLIFEFVRVSRNSEIQ